MDQELPPRKPGTFLPGHDPRRSTPKARQKGQLNRIPQDIKRGCIEGLSAHGFDGKGLDGFPGFVRYLAAKHPKAAAKIVERLLPLNIHGSGLTASTIGSINIVSVPENRFLSPADIERYRGGVSLEPALGPTQDAPEPSNPPEVLAEPVIEQALLQSPECEQEAVKPEPVAASVTPLYRYRNMYDVDR
jgi:hypothetical protein